MKRSHSNTKAQIFRSAFYLPLVLAICAMTFALAKQSFGGLTTSATPSKQTGTLSFAERVAYQRAIEEVYWRHRIWPRSPGEQSGPKPALEKIMLDVDRTLLRENLKLSFEQSGRKRLVNCGVLLQENEHRQS